MPVLLFMRGLTKFASLNNMPQVVSANLDAWPVVPDVVKGYYEMRNGTVHACSQPHAFKRIALLVESPHKDEFDQNFNPLVPLNGSSGAKFYSNIETRLRNWFQNLQTNRCFEIKVINPVQYQTSLYHFLNGLISYNKTNFNFNYAKIDKRLRNAVWRFIFEECSLKNDFIRRIQTYSPDYIVNCCTGTCSYRVWTSLNILKPSKSSQLKALTRNALLASGLLGNGNTYIEDYHPLAW